MQLMPRGQMFRQQALNKTFAADDLDQRMQVTRPTGWLALLVLGAVIAIALAWSLTGNLSIRVGARGVLLDNGTGSLEAIAFIPLAKQKSVRPGMKVRMTPDGLPPQQYGYLLGIVRVVGQYPQTSKSMADILKNDGLVAVFQQDGPMIAANIELQRNAFGTGYEWTGNRNAPVSSGTLLQADILVDEKKPIRLLLPGGGD